MWEECESIDEWLDKYVPGPNPPMSFVPYDVGLDGSEHNMCTGWINGLNRDIQTVSWEGYCALDTSQHSDPATLTRASRRSPYPDLGIYPKDTLENWLDYDPSSEADAEGDVSSTMESGFSGLTDEQRITDIPMRSRVAWGWAELLVKVKREKASPLRRSQLADYANEVFNRQHRVSFFMIVMVNDCACLVCFDRSGAAMTPSFKYLEEPDVIGKFLFRLSRLDRGGRGYDGTVKAASLEEERLFRDLHEQCHPRSAEATGLRDAATKGWRVYKVVVDAPFSTDRTPVRRNSPLVRHELLIGKPASVKGSLVGRGTRGFVAYDLTSEQVVFLKDSWRPESENIPSEFENYMLITEAIKGELHIPTLLGGGDVKYNNVVVQRTRIPTKRYHPFIHFRLVLKEVCRRLEDFKNSYQLLTAVAYAFSAHKKIWEGCKLLHRDVSARNILIHNSRDEDDPDSNDVVGLLADWDLARTAEELTRGATQQTRSGTWPFMSARLQRFPAKPHELADDIESFYHVLNWCTLLYLPHTIAFDVDSLATHIHLLYDYVTTDNPEIGSPQKLKNMEGGTPFVTMLEIKPQVPHPFRPVLVELALLFKRHYFHVPNPPEPSRSALNLETMSDASPPPSVESWATKMGLQYTPPESVETPAKPPSTVEGQDPSKSPLCNHESVLTQLWLPLRSKDGWPLADRVSGRRIILSALATSKRASGSPLVQLSDSVGSNKRSRTGISPSDVTPAVPKPPPRTSRSLAKVQNNASRSARNSPTQSASSTRSGSPITGNASPVFSGSSVQIQLSDMSSLSHETLQQWQESLRRSRSINLAMASGPAGRDEISLNSPPRSPPRMYATTTTSDPNVFSLDNLRRVYAMHTEVPLRVQHPESSQRSTQRRGDFDDADEPEEDPRAQW